MDIECYQKDCKLAANMITWASSLLAFAALLKGIFLLLQSLAPFQDPRESVCLSPLWIMTSGQTSAMERQATEYQIS